jgi:protoporphyrin/coproporphyrin ferrochelatase
MTGVILLNMGGPDSPDSIRPFLYNLFSDREIIRLGPAFLQKPLASIISAFRSGHSKQIYEMIGGKSPMPAITQAQACALQNELRSGDEASSGGPYRVSVGMTYWRPFIKTAVKNMTSYGVDELVALSLYPQYSRATTGSAMRKFREAAGESHVKYRCIESWHDHPGYLDALAEKIMEGMTAFSHRPVVLFSAHSLPQKLIDEGDPYLEHTMGTISALEEKISMTWSLSFQSRSGPVKWLGPSTEDKLAELAAKGVKNLLVVPISFVSDHVETLYEIDILYRDLASDLGINLRRTDSLNTSPTFIRALADIIISSASAPK